MTTIKYENYYMNFDLYVVNEINISGIHNYV